jgi:hypothetical protein
MTTLLFHRFLFGSNALLWHPAGAAWRQPKKLKPSSHNALDFPHRVSIMMHAGST